MEDLQQEHKIDYSIIVPVYNGEKSIEELCSKVLSFFQATTYCFEIIFVDDYSIDGSWEVIADLKNNNENLVRGARLSKNFGQHTATCVGFKMAKGEFVITIDDDLEVDPTQMQLLIDEQIKTKSIVVYGSLVDVQRSFFRKISKFIFCTIARVVEGKNKVRGSSFRLIKTTLAKQIEQQSTHFIFIDEVILWYTNKISYVNVKHSVSKRGQSNYTSVGLFKLTGELIMYSSIFPLKFVKYLGFLCSLINFIIGTYYLYQKTFNSVAVQGYASIVISILFSTGLIIFILGVLGEYLSKIFYVVNNRPVYLIDEEI